MKRIVLIVIVLVALLGVVVRRVYEPLERRWEVYEQSTVKLPPEDQKLQSLSQSSHISSVTSLRHAVNWDVPFTPQAPLANWDALHEEACEEASILMVLRYFEAKGFDTAEHAESLLQDLVRKNASLGFPVDDTAEQMKTLLLSENPTLSVSLLQNPTVPALQEALSAGKLIIVPVAGRLLKNPYFQHPGPLYHVLVLRGYTEDGVHVITNDPGTKRGEQFAYTWERILSANHDWNGGDVESGDRLMLVVGR